MQPQILLAVVAADKRNSHALAREGISTYTDAPHLVHPARKQVSVRANLSLAPNPSVTLDHREVENVRACSGKRVMLRQRYENNSLSGSW